MNGHEIEGRALVVNNTYSEKNRMELESLLRPSQNKEIRYGEAVPADEAPAAISRAVASLPPERMFELLKGMKSYVANNPNEARQMLLQNPTLAYALLHAQVIMRIVDPHTACSMLHRANPIPEVLMPIEPSMMMPSVVPRIEEPSLPRPPPPIVSANPPAPTICTSTIDFFTFFTFNSIIFKFFLKDYNNRLIMYLLTH